MENLSFQYPTWYLLLCLGLGLVYALALYFRENKFSISTQWWRYLLGLLRMLAVAGLAGLLLSPLLRSTTEETKKPTVVILEDTSESMGLGFADEGYGTFQNSVSSLAQQLEGKYEVDHLTFGDQIFSSGDTAQGQSSKVTNISQAMQHAYDIYNDQNLGAIVMISDGIFNEGRNPIYQNLGLKAPVFTVGVGDTTIKTDVALKHVYHNKIAYLGDKFSIQADVQANNALNRNTSLTVYKEVNDKLVKVKQENIRIDKNDFFTTRNIILDSDAAGVNRYRISLSQIPNEKSTGNNIQDIYVDVLDARQKILILANAPHPDLSALSQLLSTNKNYEVEVKYADENVQGAANYDLVIFHNLPSKKHTTAAILNTINKSKKPRMYIAGTQTDLRSFNKIQSTLNIKGNNSNQNEVQAIIDPSFNLFNIDESVKSKIPGYVPLVSPFGEYNTGPKTNVLLYQRIGKVDTKYPLLSFSEEGGIKTTVLSGEGIWKWKLFNHLQDKNFDTVKELISKTLTYTTVKEDKRKFRVANSKNLYKENEHIYFDAELYNNSYERINEPEAFMTVRDSQGKEYNFTFSKNDNAYALDAGLFPQGKYRWTANLTYNAEKMQQSGQFTVQSIQLERYNLTADHTLLNNLSSQYGGQFYTGDNIADLQTELINSDEIKPILYSSSSTKSILQLPWILGILLILLVVEWFLRRYFGSY